jgi:hypothetical protein
LKATTQVYAGAAFLNTDGNLNGSVWLPWGSNEAFAAINARIEARALAYANDRVQQLAYRKTAEGNSGTVTNFKCPAGAVVTGYSRLSGTNGEVNFLYYMFLQVFDPVRGWVGFTG